MFGVSFELKETSAGIKALIVRIDIKIDIIIVIIKLLGTCVLFRTHSISEVRFFRETNYDAGTFYEKIRFHSHKDKTQFCLLRIVI